MASCKILLLSCDILCDLKVICLTYEDNILSTKVHGYVNRPLTKHNLSVYGVIPSELAVL